MIVNNQHKIYLISIFIIIVVIGYLGIKEEYLENIKTTIILNKNRE
jgi:hypothetical protein